MTKILIIMAFIVSSMFFIYILTHDKITCNPADLNETYSKKDLLDKCGKPGHINASTGSEQWVYNKGFPILGGTYLYIRNGHFSSAQWVE